MLLSLIIATTLAISGCATARTGTAAPTEATPASVPSPTPTPDKDRDMKAALILKRAADVYRQQLGEGHGYLRAGKTDYYDAWWSYLTQGILGSGLFVDTARTAYSDATELYGLDQYPKALDDWDELMDGRGQLVTHATLWHDRGNEAEYQAALITLDNADRLADKIAPGVTYTPSPVPPLDE
ncbi:hypothetical protein DAD99_20805 [Pseudarthrobacter sp. AB1]|nr:hypothetical protein [Pseudarthrobacter sp. AB1]